MTANRRSFTRELLALMPVMETEFSGQVKVDALEEMTVNEVILEVTPLKGYYAHASFLFHIRASCDYPVEKPGITCLTPVFHPNIGDYVLEGNVCLNLFRQWNPRFGLRDLLYALLFLFYEPNFDDPMNDRCVQPEEGLTMEETIRKSFYGGRVNGVFYEPNESWLRWAKENGLSLPSPSVAKDRCENTQDPPIASPARLDSTISDYFHRVLSGQYSPIYGSMYDNFPYARQHEILVDFAHVCSVTVRPASSSSDVVDLLIDSQRYYYLEQCNYARASDIWELISKSVCTSAVERYAVLFGSQQISFSAVPRVRPQKSIETFSEDSFYNQPNYDLDVSGAQECEPFSSRSDCSAERFPFDQVPTVETMNVASVPDEEEDKGTEPQVTGNVEDGEQLNETIGLPEEVAEREIVSDDGNHAGGGNDGLEDQWEAVSDVEVDTEEHSRSESVSTTYSELLLERTCQQNKIADLTPWWWMFYQSRWPGYLAPRHLTTVEGKKYKRLYARASSIVLHCDLYRVGVRFERPTPFLLVDSLLLLNSRQGPSSRLLIDRQQHSFTGVESLMYYLSEVLMPPDLPAYSHRHSLSPFSPILNRAVTFRGRAKESVNWYSLDWYSVWDAFRPYGRGSPTPRTHFYTPMLVFGLCYLHNWLAYMSRVELYGSCLGYSRPLNAGVVTSAAATCLTIASLGCGQCGLLDMWPLWLMWRLCRHLCRLAVFCCSRPVWSDEDERGSSRGIRTRVCFPFSDLDEL